MTDGAKRFQTIGSGPSKNMGGPKPGVLGPLRAVTQYRYRYAGLHTAFYQWWSQKVYKSLRFLTSLGVWVKCKCKGGMVNYRSFWGYGLSVICRGGPFWGHGVSVNVRGKTQPLFPPYVISCPQKGQVRHHLYVTTCDKCDNSCDFWDNSN